MSNDEYDDDNNINDKGNVSSQIMGKEGTAGEVG